MDICLNDIIENVKLLRWEKDRLVKEEKKLSSGILIEKEAVTEIEKIREIILNVSESVGTEIKNRLSSIVSTALRAVFDNPPEFVMDIVYRRNQMEIDLFYEESEKRYSPETGSGGGMKDITSFALKVGIWSLDRTLRPTFVLDEPFKDVSPDLQHRVSDMLKELSEELGLQIIMISHAEDINVSANKTFVVSKKGNKSHIKDSEWK